MEFVRRKTCHYCRDEITGSVPAIGDGHIFCSQEHRTLFKLEHKIREPYEPLDEVEGPSPAFKWIVAGAIGLVMLLGFAVAAFADTNIPTQHGGIQCASDVLCKGEDVVMDGNNYICSDPYSAIDVAKTHAEEGLMKAKSHWDKWNDEGKCINYPNMDGVIGDLIFESKEARVISFDVAWPKKHVYLITKMKWKSGIVI